MISISGLRDRFSVNGTDLNKITVKLIPRQNLPVLNFGYHLPKSWTDRFAHVGGKQLGGQNLRSVIVLSLLLT